MLRIKSLVVYLLGYFVLESNAGVVSFIKPCKASDSACLVSSAQAAIPYVAAGIPELGVPRADPIDIDLIESHQNNLKLDLHKNHIVGPSKSKIIEVVRDTEKQTIKIVLETPLTINGEYNLIGRILFVDAIGEGEFELQTDRLGITVIAKYKIIENDGNKYWKITGFDYTYDLLEKFHIKLGTLFKGDDVKTKQISDLLKENDKEVINEFGKPVFEKIINEYINIIKKMLLHVPTSELELV